MGSSSEDITLEGGFRVTGPVRTVVDGERVLGTPVEVAPVPVATGTADAAAPAAAGR
ncbi:hypothetical protein [Brachybacterium sp. sponge]|uniref:hypothetical protein n=1 Tax=Brachybacterium sp. sponge TaxID=1775432 RepID=UPI000B216A9C|nr:hypothetical protein [Brachybacterium sp. sponge]